MTAAKPVHPYIHVIAVAIIGAVGVLAWLVVFEVVNRLLWENDFVTENRWMFPVICLPFSLLAGLLVKYRHAPTTLDESMLDSLQRRRVEDRLAVAPVNVVMALVSLFSGAVLGPEGGIGGIASKIAAFYGERVAIPAEHRSRLVFATIAAAYNGLVASPLFTGVLGSELIKGPRGAQPQPAGQPDRRLDRLPDLLRRGRHGPAELPAPRRRPQPIQPRSTSSS